MTDCKALITPQWYVVLIVSNLALYTNIIMQSAIIHFINTGKGKAVPLQAWTGPEGSRRLRLPNFKTIGT